MKKTPGKKTTWWVFTNPVTRRAIRVQNPGGLPGFQRWNLGTPIARIDGVEQVGHAACGEFNGAVICSRQCEIADPHTDCVCSCGGKNHGADWKGISTTRTSESEEEAWDKYVDGEMSPAI